MANEYEGAYFQTKQEIMEAYLFLRKNNMTVPSETLDLMKDAAIEKLDSAFENTEKLKLAEEHAKKMWRDPSAEKQREYAEHSFKEGFEAHERQVDNSVDIGGLPVRKVCFFSLKDGKYMTENNIEITTDMLVKYNHQITDGWSFVILD